MTLICLEINTYSADSHTVAFLCHHVRQEVYFAEKQFYWFVVQQSLEASKQAYFPYIVKSVLVATRIK